MNVSENPYAAPVAPIGESGPQAVDSAEVEQVRRKYLKHEASVQSIGGLYYLGAMLWLGVAAYQLSLLLTGKLGRSGPVESGLAVVWVVFCAISLILGRGLRKLDRRVKIPVVILSAIGLLKFPIGTLINGYIIYLVAGKKGQFVFSPEYREVIRQTPHIKYKTSIVVLVLAALLIALLLAGTIAYLFTGK